MSTENNAAVAESRNYGIITRAVGGVYYVDALSGFEESAEKRELHPDGRELKCAARGIFRNDGISPSAGDIVEVVSREGCEPLIAAVLPRKNYLVRPPLANLDGIVFVISCADPAPNRFVLDKLIAIADSKAIEPMIAFTKCDLGQAEELAGIYRKIGITVCMVNNIAHSSPSIEGECCEGAETVRRFIDGRVTAFIGNSGVGKSSLMNTLFPALSLETAAISKKLGRGRHTTRQATLYRLSDLSPEMSGYAADTPGFSTVDTERYCRIPAAKLDNSFREFAEFAQKCRFADCAHIKERDCAVRQAAECGEIARSRYESYLRMYEEASKVNDWE